MLLSATIITKNKEKNIEARFDRLAFCGERIVVDGDSDGGTMPLAEKQGARVVSDEWQGFGAQKNFALSLAQGDRVLWCARADNWDWGSKYASI